MKINKENCEAYFLDYYEGNLSKEGVEELFAFLTLNPDMREVFDSYDEVSFSPDKQIHFDGKADLKKSEEFTDGINESNYEEYFVSEVEGLLNAEEKVQLEKFIALNPGKRAELELLSETILKPDTSVVFEHKASLIKSVLVSEANFDEMAVSSMEGLLNPEEEKVFAASLVANPEQQKSFELYKQTKLSADASIVFEDKESLKRKENDRGGLWWMRDIRFAAAAAVILFIGIFYWNYSGKTDLKKDGSSIAKIDTLTKNKGIAPDQKSNDQFANTNPNDSVPRIINANDQKNQFASNNSQRHKHISTIKWSSKVATTNTTEKTPFVYVAFNSNLPLLKSSVNPQVDFTDAYYDYAYELSSPVARTDISMRQAAMRWMKKKLDHTSDEDQNEKIVFASYGANNSQNGDVTGFDLTSSAVNRLGEATGANIHLGKEDEGTILTVGKYRVLLNRKR